MKKNPSRNVHFSKGPSEILDAINTSIDIDQRLYKEDITGSIAHARMLGKQKIINKKEQSAIVSGLKAIERDIEKNKVVFSKKLEKTVKIGIITKKEIKIEDIYQKFILIIYNPPYKNEKVFMSTLGGKRHLA